MPLTDEQVRERAEKKRRIQENYFRRRWLLTVLYSFNLSMSMLEISQKRSQWPGLMSLHSLTQFSNVSSVEWNVFAVFIWSLGLYQLGLGV